MMFRVWNKQTKKYMKNMVVDKDGTLYFRGAMFPQSPEEYIFERCSGLLDRNGTPIYEGDIVRCDRDFNENGRVNLIKEVTFWMGCFRLQNLNPHDRDACCIDRFHRIEVINNIHEWEEQKNEKHCLHF